MDVFGIESLATRQLQRKMGMNDFDHVIIHDAITRPARRAYCGARGSDEVPELFFLRARSIKASPNASLGLRLTLLTAAVVEG